MKISRNMLIPLLVVILTAWAAFASSQEAPATDASQVATPDSTLRDTLSPDSLSSETFIDSLFYTCDSVKTDAKNEIITLSGDANIRYQDALINADTIRIEMKRDLASSQGRVELKDRSYIMLGDALYYNIESREALVDQGATRFDAGFFYGSEIRKVGDEVYDIDDGYFTTCDAADPDYYIWSKRMRIYRNDKLVTRPTVFFVNHFPVLALPFGAISIKRGRQTGILIPEPGYNSTDGKYIKNIAYFYAWKDYADATLSFDWMELTGWDASLEGRYLKRYVLDGEFLATLQERNLGFGRTHNEWRLVERHHQNIGYASMLDANLDFVSSRTIWEGSEDVDERLNENVTSRLAYQTPLFSRNLYLNASYDEDLSDDVKTLTLPSVSYTMPSRPVYELFTSEADDDSDDDENDEESWWRKFSYSTGFKAVHTGRVTDPDASWRDVLYRSKRDSTGSYMNEHHAGLRQKLGLSWSTKISGWLNLSQSLNSAVGVYDRDRENNKLPVGYEWSGVTRTSFSLYGVRNFNRGLLTAVRHVITPTVSFTYKPDFTENDSLYSFGGIGINSSDRSRSFSFSLVNLWQLKLRDGDEERKLNDFFKITSGLSFDLEKDGERFSNISHTAKLNPGDITTPLLNVRFTDQLTLTQDAYDFEFTYWRLNSSMTLSGEAQYAEYFPREPNRFQTSRFMQADSLETEEEEAALTIDRVEQQAEKDGWSWDITHSYSRRKGADDPSTHSLRNTLAFRLTRNWYVSYSHNYDFLDDRIVSQDLTLTRTMHCWKLTFSFYKSGDYWNYKLRLFAIKLPDALQFRTSDHKH